MVRKQMNNGHTLLPRFAMHIISYWGLGVISFSAIVRKNKKNEDRGTHNAERIWPHNNARTLNAWPDQKYLVYILGVCIIE